MAFAKPKKIAFLEFVTLMALMTSLTALSTNAMLPALPAIGNYLSVANANDLQLIVSFLFLGMAVGMIFYGPLSDSVGRKPPIYAGISIYIVGCLISLLATDLDLMLVGRFVQGFGLAAFRTLCLAMVRDQYKGDVMSRVMSFIMGVYIFVPAIAPTIGQAIVHFIDWHVVFLFFVALSLTVLIWITLRQPETLAKENKKPLTFATLASGLKDILTNPVALGYTIASGFVLSPFLAYMSTSQQVFQELYGLGPLYPAVFAVLSLSVGLASFLNAKLVMKFGMLRMALASVTVMVVVAAVVLWIAYFINGLVPFWLTMLYFPITLFCVGILFGNLNSLAMQPLGHIAGLGAAFVGSISNFISIPFAIIIGKAYANNVTPIVGGFLVFGLLTLGIIIWVNRWSQSSVATAN
ncbi:multidrug effflux MFS transporter [Reinekea sp. G2M2-21]|uniref:multidrug effflux MFS transporter n=1 Tax=Reinekea sp. G2M2-21 TaxID=2788942 RepID=UPI0018AAE73A|nr:multidrug effflux MFS transporter [Reinekea sp. G2M2-21]